MVTVFTQHRMICIVFLLLLLLSIICQMAIGVIFRNMIRETDNMSATSNKRLKQCKLKFVNCYQLNGSVANVPVFVDKFLGKLTFLGISLTGLQHLSGQLTLLSVALAGIGACQEIIRGESIGNVLPYYIASFLGLYVYFSISGMVDIQGKRERLKINLVDYLENHMVNKLRQSAIDWEGLTGEQIGRLRERMEQERRLREQEEEAQSGRWEGASQRKESAGEKQDRAAGRQGSDSEGRISASGKREGKTGRHGSAAVAQESMDAGWREGMESVWRMDAQAGRHSKENWEEEYGAQEAETERLSGEGKVAQTFSRKDEQELEELLREFFT